MTLAEIIKRMDVHAHLTEADRKAFRQEQECRYGIGRLKPVIRVFL